MNLLQNIQGRIAAVVGAVFAAICFLGFGALLAFYISPQQALEWRRIEGLPELDATAYASAASGQEVAITGTLADNFALTPEGLVAYIREQWDVTPPSDKEDKPDGSWKIVETNVPVLRIAIAGGGISTTSVESATFSGSLHETAIQQGAGTEKADYNGQSLPEGSTRMRGFANGDLITVVGHKASTGDLIPDRLFGGDRVQLVQEIRSGAQAMFVVGIVMMICSPLILVMGVVGALFGRSKAKVKFG